jgi:hypothetical protein
MHHSPVLSSNHHDGIRRPGPTPARRNYHQASKAFRTTTTQAPPTQHIVHQSPHRSQATYRLVSRRNQRRHDITRQHPTQLQQSKERHRRYREASHRIRAPSRTTASRTPTTVGHARGLDARHAHALPAHAIYGNTTNDTRRLCFADTTAVHKLPRAASQVRRTARGTKQSTTQRSRANGTVAEGCSVGSTTW